MPRRRPREEYRIAGCRLWFERTPRPSVRVRVVVILKSGTTLRTEYYTTESAALRELFGALHRDPDPKVAGVAKQLGPLLATSLTSRAKNGR